MDLFNIAESLYASYSKHWGEYVALDKKHGAHNNGDASCWHVSLDETFHRKWEYLTNIRLIVYHSIFMLDVDERMCVMHDFDTALPGETQEKYFKVTRDSSEPISREVFIQRIFDIFVYIKFQEEYQYEIRLEIKAAEEESAYYAEYDCDYDEHICY